MQSFKVAHFREQGVDLIVVFVNESVGRMADSERQRILNALQLCANGAGLAGSVVLVWPRGFFCDPNLHPFFRSVPYPALVRNINRQLNCPLM